MKRYDSYKYSGQQWLGDIPIHWCLRKMKFSFSERVEKGFPSEPLLAATQSHGVIPKSLYENRTVEAIKGLEQLKLVEIGDFVISLRSFQGGIEYAYYRGIISPAYTVLRPTFMGSGYFKYFGKSLIFIDLLRSTVTGIREGQNIDYSKLKQNYLPIPPITEQEAIEVYLDTITADIDKAIVQQQRMIDLLNERKQIIIQKELLPNIAQKKESEMWFGALPPKWQSIRLKYILAERNERSETGSEEPLSMSQKYGLIPTSQMDVIPNMAASFVGAKKAYIGDLVFNKLKAHLGVFAVSEYNGLVSPDYAVYYANSKVNLRYLQFLFKNPMMIAEFRRRSSGVGEGLTRLYTKDLFSIYIPLPSLEEQNRVVENIEIMTKQIANHIAFCENTIKLLLERKRIIINDVVTGKVKIS